MIDRPNPNDKDASKIFTFFNGIKGIGNISVGHRSDRPGVDHVVLSASGNGASLTLRAVLVNGEPAIVVAD